MGTNDSKNYLYLNFSDADEFSSDEKREIAEHLAFALAEAGIPVTFTSNGKPVGGDA